MQRTFVTRRDGALSLCGLAALLAFPFGLGAQGVCATNDSMPSVIEIRVDVSKEVKSKSLACGKKVSESNDVRVVLANFNGIRYKPTLAVEGTAVESYQAVLGLWTEIMGPDATQLSFLQVKERSILDRWSQRLREMGAALRSGRDAAGDAITLSTARAREIAMKADALAKLIPELDSLRLAAEGSLALEGNSSRLPLVEYYARRHDDLVPAIREHAILARRSANGWSEPVRSFDAGTQVSVAVAIAPREGADVAERREYSIRYLVESKLPVVFHAGFGFTDLSGVKYEKVSTVSSGDAFKELASPQSDVGLTAFLTYLFPFTSGDWRLGASLGTDVDEAKKSLHAGLTLLIADRFALTAGWTGRNDDEGVNAIGSDLYETVRGIRRDRLFFAFSVVPGR